MKKKGQAAMEYLMTYGWAILIVIIVAAALWALGVFNPSTWTQAAATGFAGFGVPNGGWQVNSTGALVVLKNSAGANVRVTAITATYGSNTWTNASAVSDMAANGQSTIYLVGSGGPSA